MFIFFIANSALVLGGCEVVQITVTTKMGCEINDPYVTHYYTTHRAWKKGGVVSREFVKILFHGDNFIPCRICEAVAKS